MCVGVILELHTGWVQEPFLIGKLIRPHDVEVGGAERLQSFARVDHLREHGEWRRLQKRFSHLAKPVLLFSLNLLTTNSTSTGLPMSSRLVMALSPFTAPLKKSWCGLATLQRKQESQQWVTQSGSLWGLLVREADP